MADPITVTSPDFRGVVDQQFFLRPLGAPGHPQTYLDSFPDSLYNKAIDSHFVRFMFALLGPAGMGSLKKNYLEARLKLEELGLDAFDLDKFYGNPLGFGRILEEVYDQDPGGLLDQNAWEQIRAKDANYRNRAIDYVSGLRAGTTPLGMKLVSRSGLGHEVEIWENYRYIYDQLSDDPLGLPNLGLTGAAEEFVVIPRRELPQNELQVLTIIGSPTGGTFKLFFPAGNNSTTATISFNALAEEVKLALEALPTIGRNVQTYGGPLPDNPVQIIFVGDLANRDVPTLQIAEPAFTGGTLPQGLITTEANGISSTDEIVSIGPRDRKYLYDALSRVKPVATVVSFNQGHGTMSKQTWNQAFTGSAYTEVIRYVTGKNGVPWPARDSVNWIEAGVEHQAQRAVNDLQQHYAGFHNVTTITSSSNHVGPFSPYQRALFSVLAATRPVDYAFAADQVLADYAEPLTIRGSVGTEPLVNGIYPVSWESLPGTNLIKYRDEQFWSSSEQTEGDEWLEIDLGSVKPVNYLYFEALRKPVNLEISYDILDQAPDREWRVVTFETDLGSPTSYSYSTDSNLWTTIEMFFETTKRSMIFTRFLHIKFSRRSESPFQANDGTKLPYSIDVRNLRVGRNVV